MRISMYLGLLVGVLLLAACQNEEVTHSEYFNKVFKPQSEGTFRGLDLGCDLDTIRRREGIAPVSDDKFGLVYRFNLGDREKCMVEYMSPEGEKRTLKSILVNVLLKEEAKTTKFYNESEAFLRGRHGVPDGSFGGYVWKDEARNLDISLRLLADKKSFSLNFVRPR